MDRIVCRKRHTHQVFRIQNKIHMIIDLLEIHWVHVVNVNPSVNIPALDAEIASVVASDHDVANMLPFFGTIKPLIDVSIKSKGFNADRSGKKQISKTFIECP